jgi:outer membrane immunogenic protein
MHASFEGISVIWTGDDMKTLLAASLTGLALLSGSALAADLPPAPQVYKAPPVVAPAYSWTGFYLNAGGGYGMWNADTQVFLPSGACFTCVVDTFGGRGYFGTVGGGYDFQVGGLGMGAWNPMIVVGLMADYNFESFKGTTDIGIALVSPIKETAAWAGGARIGLAFGPNLFTYINGGATGTRFSGTNYVSSVTGAPLGLTGPAFWKTGWFLGGGTETSLNPMLPVGWFLRSEYRYSYFSTTNETVNLVGAPFVVVGFHPVVQTLSTSIVYKFNWQ